MHGIVGEPTEEMESRMKGIGSYFQEASYAVRDFRRGTLDKGEFKFKTDDLDLDDDAGTDDEEYWWPRIHPGTRYIRIVVVRASVLLRIKIVYVNKSFFLRLMLSQTTPV